MPLNYCDHFIDRSPHILAAGKIAQDNFENVASTLKEYTVDDVGKVLEIAAGKSARQPFTYKLPELSNNLRSGIYTQIRPILRPKVHTRYQTIINELKETTYDSHWNRVLGKCRDPVPGLPRGKDPVQTTFGGRNCPEASVKELINPPKSVYQVLENSQIGHEMYKRTHNDYNPGERICRNYTKAFDANRRFGTRSRYDPRGIWVKCACHWYETEPVTRCSQIQAEFNKKFKPKLERFNGEIGDQLPKDFTFGKTSSRPLYGMAELLRDPDCPPCLLKTDLENWMAEFNKLKFCWKRRDVDFGALHQKLLYFDKTRSGYIPLDLFYTVCSCFMLSFNRQDLEHLLRCAGVVDNDNNKIHYPTFVDLLRSRTSLNLLKIDEIPKTNQYYVSTTQAASCDYLIIDNTKYPAAGIPSIRTDLARAIVPIGGCRADLEHFGSDTSSGSLVNPCIYLNYGLSFRDFFIPRDKVTIRQLFEKIGYEFTDQIFEQLWCLALEQDKTGRVCVDTFYKLLKSRYPDERKLIVDEATC